MKRIFAILLTALSAFACTKEGPHDGCPGELTLVFAHDGNVQDFDSRIGNDVMLHIYEGDEFFESRIVSYEEINGGKQIIIPKTFSGKVDLVAWSLPSELNIANLVGCSADRARYPDAYFDISEHQGVRAEDAPLRLSPLRNPLFLGKLNLQESMMTSSTHIVSLKDIACQVNVQVENAESFGAQYPGKASVGLEGTSCRISVHSSECCDERRPEMVADFTEESNRLTSGNMGVMPATNRQTRAQEKDKLRVNVYNDGKAAFYVDTDEVATAGKNITIVIRMEQKDAQIVVDGWTVRTQKLNLH